MVGGFFVDAAFEGLYVRHGDGDGSLDRLCFVALCCRVAAEDLWLLAVCGSNACDYSRIVAQAAPAEASSPRGASDLWLRVSRAY